MVLFGIFKCTILNSVYRDIGMVFGIYFDPYGIFGILVCGISKLSIRHRYRKWHIIRYRYQYIVKKLVYRTDPPYKWMYPIVTAKLEVRTKSNSEILELLIYSIIFLSKVLQLLVHNSLKISLNLNISIFASRIWSCQNFQG